MDGVNCVLAQYSRAHTRQKMRVLAFGSHRWLRFACARVRAHVARDCSRLPDLRNLAICHYRPWPTDDRCFSLISEECRRNLHLGIPELSGFSFQVDINTKVRLFPTMEPPV